MTIRHSCVVLLMLAMLATATPVPRVYAEEATSTPPAAPATLAPETPEVPPAPAALPALELPTAPSVDEELATSTPPTASTTPTFASTTPAIVSGTGGAEGNSATGTPSTGLPLGPTIISGRALAFANILNILNTNLVNSRGGAILLNYADLVSHDVDFRTASSSFAGAGCTQLVCAHAGRTVVNASSTALITNAVYLSAGSGANVAAGTDPRILTGDAYAGLNLINIANSNIIDSQYLLVTMNAFNGVQGDLVFPSLTNFFATLAGNLSLGSFSSNADASVDTVLSAHADSGNNVAGAPASSVTTGDSYAAGNVFNAINTNLIGGSSIALLFRIQGSWAGQLFGAPPGLAWTEGENGGVLLFSETAGMVAGAASSETSVAATTSALIDNDLEIIALTGENRAEGEGSALISTGNARAGANVVNVANTNIVGRNWILAVINIFGDFLGNISFGRPDLWVGSQAVVPKPLMNGGTITYKIAVINNGDAPASGIRLAHTYDPSRLRVVDSSAPYSEDGPTLLWQIGTLPPGGATEITYRASLFGAGDNEEITHTSSVTAVEPDNNMDDNTDVITIRTAHRSADGPRSARTPDLRQVRDAHATTTPHFSVSRATAVRTYDRQVPVHQEFTLSNLDATPTIPVVVHDVLVGPTGIIIHDEAWDVGAVDGNEDIVFGYDLAFAADAPAGAYSLSTVVRDTSGDIVTSFPHNGTIIVPGAPVPDPLPGIPNTGALLPDVPSVFDVPVVRAAGLDAQAAVHHAARVPYEAGLIVLAFFLMALGAAYEQLARRR